jgi:hypothetical protein
MPFGTNHIAAAPTILFAGYIFDMVRVTARSVPAKMVKLARN